MCIADRADDAGSAWPSIPGICEWTCLGRNTVIDNVKVLESLGLVVIEKAMGRNNRFQLNLEVIVGMQPVRQPNPCAARTSPPAKPVRQPDPSESRTPTSPAAAPPPVRQPDYTRPAAGPEASVSIIQASTKHQPRIAKRSSKSSAELPADDLPNWIPPEVWQAFIEMRDGKGKAMTLHAQMLMLAKLARLRDAGQDVQAVLEQSVLNGWTDCYVVKAERASASSEPTESKPGWATAAGFATRFDAENAGCYERNATAFRNGKRLETV